LNIPCPIFAVSLKQKVAIDYKVRISRQPANLKGVRFMTIEAMEQVVPTNFERIFHPKRLAVIGVSAGSYGFGSGMIFSLCSFGYQGELFPVNPKGGTIAGRSIYKSIADIPGELDFAIIAVPAPLVPQALEECRQKGAAGAEILSAGFKELGTPEGIAIEQEIKRISRKGIRVVGPNCFGIYCPQGGITIPPGGEFPKESGSIAFLAQSGGMVGDFVMNGTWLGLRFSKVVSFGNGVDLRETELLQYLGDDPETRIICLYVEGVEDGRAFFQVLKRVATKKPVLIYKGGLSRAGQRAVTSHTASLGGSRTIWESMLRQANAVQVKNSWELSQATLAFALLPERAFNGIAVVGGGGALGVTACDAAESFGIELPILRPETQTKLMAVLPKPGSSATNPIDAANPRVPPELLKKVLLKAADEDQIQLQILIQLLYVYKSFRNIENLPLDQATPYGELAGMIEEVQNGTDKPVVLVLPNNRRGLEDLDVEEVRRKAIELFHSKNIVTFENLVDAFRAISQVSGYYGRREAGQAA
jgi:acetate---CoA ligase (ADP-forming) subunit alpha